MIIKERVVVKVHWNSIQQIIMYALVSDTKSISDNAVQRIMYNYITVYASK